MNKKVLAAKGWKSTAAAHRCQQLSQEAAEPPGEPTGEPPVECLRLGLTGR